MFIWQQYRKQTKTEIQIEYKRMAAYNNLEVAFF